MDYTIYAALTEEENEGWIWFEQPNFKTRTLVKVYNPDTNRSILCVSRHIDENFLRRYNGRCHIITITNPSKSLVINEWYRDALGGFATTFHSGHDLTLIITPLKLWGWRDVRAACQHPDIVARIGTRLGLVGTWLGVVGVAGSVLEFSNPGRATKLTIFLVMALLTALTAYFASRGTKR
jgi:hypothetical protein